MRDKLITIVVLMVVNWAMFSALSSGIGWLEILAIVVLSLEAVGLLLLLLLANESRQR